jgi:hypothetical protein
MYIEVVVSIRVCVCPYVSYPKLLKDFVDIWYWGSPLNAVGRTYQFSHKLLIVHRNGTEHDL